MKKNELKFELLFRVLDILCTSEFPLSRAELARKIGVHPSTIGRYIDDLSRLFPLQEDEDRRLWIDKRSRLVNIILSSSEIIALNLACRLLSRKVRFPYRAAASALRKLAIVFGKYSGNFGQTISHTADRFDYGIGHQNHRYEGYLEKITEALVGQKILHVKYDSRNNPGKVYLIHAHHIEPYAEGNALHLIGFDPEENMLRNLKLEKIIDIQVCDSSHEFDIAFNPDEYFSSAWGIWTGDEEPEKVVLRFDAESKSRVLATNWHDGEVKTENSDGSLTWTSRIAEPKEMVPWIQGWGARVEVVEPKWLRKKVAAEAKATARLYETEE